MHLRSRRATTKRVRCVVLAIVSGILLSSVTLTVGPALAAPVNPSDQQLAGAKARKESVASQVGTLTAQIATMQAELARLEGEQELAEQKLAFAQSQLEEAQAKAQAADAAVAAANAKVDGAKTAFVSYQLAVYKSGGVDGATGGLLTADDPTALLERGSLEQYQTQHQLSAIERLQRATVEQSNANAAAKQAVKDRESATQAAAAARDAAIQALHDGESKKAQIQEAQATAQKQLDAAQKTLSTLTNQRKKYEAYQAAEAEKRRQARLKREAEERARRQAEEAARQRAEQQRQQEQQRQHEQQGQQRQEGHQQSSNSAGSAPVYVPPPAPEPSGGSWSASKAADAIQRAKNWLGETYIWAGGNASGPTTGGCTDPVAPCGTRGFDCSGLVLYAWAPYLRLNHYSVTQYDQAGSFHPSPDQFRPGDLLFWSYTGTVSGIHHVAMYIGDGKIIQAPQSGDVVKISNWDYNMGGFLGATRPLS